MRVKAGVNIIDLAKMAGTSVNHIENTYLKYSEDMTLNAAMKNFRITKEGIMSELILGNLLYDHGRSSQTT